MVKEDSIIETTINTRGVALVLEGGGFRGVFTAAVLDVFQEAGLQFPYLIGVSAGAAYSVSYVAGQYQRNLEVNRFVNDPRYCGFRHWLRKGNFFNWDFIYHEIPTAIIPFDYKAFSQSPSHIKVVVCDIEKGAADYQELRTDRPEDFRDWLAATSALPILSRPVAINGKLYMDGGLVDSIPLQQALADGNERAIVVLTRPKGYRKKASRSSWFLRLYYWRYPKLAALLQQRARVYNQRLEEVERLEKEGKVFVIRPDAEGLVSRMENEPEHLAAFYQLSLARAKESLPRLSDWLGR